MEDGEIGWKTERERGGIREKAAEGEKATERVKERADNKDWTALGLDDWAGLEWEEAAWFGCFSGSSVAGSPKWLLAAKQETEVEAGLDGKSSGKMEKFDTDILGSSEAMRERKGRNGKVHALHTINGKVPDTPFSGTPTRPQPFKAPWGTSTEQFEQLEAWGFRLLAHPRFPLTAPSCVFPRESA
ncbi:hypothetical protein CCMA1212_004432 [Trichoderma ghanense]|uniref:Uncharacterized protein n=1 Tax=Trichoderma ghanense TaxID=65468 RepID=A0ABY2H5J1_9HYPO